MTAESTSSTAHHQPGVGPLPDVLELGDGRRLQVTFGQSEVGEVDVLEPTPDAPPGCFARLVINESLPPLARHLALFLSLFSFYFDVSGDISKHLAVGVFPTMVRSGLLAGIDPSVIPDPAEIDRLAVDFGLADEQIQ